MMARTLIIVDMQNGTALSKYHGNHLDQAWWSRHTEVVDNILELCAKIPDRIFITDTRFVRKDYLEIIEKLIAIPSRERLLKNREDGSDVLAPYLFADNEMVVCGMNTDACVIKTATGLQEKGLSVAVVGDACWTVYAPKSPWSHSGALRRMRIDNIKILKTSAVSR